MNAIKFIFLIIILISCSKDNNEQKKDIKTLSEFPLIDDKKNIQSSENQVAPINYIGKIRSKIIFRKYDEKYEFSKVSRNTLSKINKNRQLDIRFDLNQKLIIPKAEYQSQIYSCDTSNLEAFPVCLFNTNEEDFFLPTLYYLPIEIEVKIGSRWMQFLSNLCENYYSSGYINCNTPPKNCIIIEPQNMVCFKLPKLKGKIKVKQRIKCLNFISEEFEGGISELELERLKVFSEWKLRQDKK